MSRLNKAKETFYHKLAIFKLWYVNDTKVSFYRVFMHDTIKLFLILIVGDKLATQLHRRFAKHHNIRTYNDFSEAYLDWASARYTKEDKPLDALETARMWFPEYYIQAVEFYKIVKYK